MSLGMDSISVMGDCGPQSMSWCCGFDVRHPLTCTSLKWAVPAVGSIPVSHATSKLKKLPDLHPDEVRKAFGGPKGKPTTDNKENAVGDVEVFTDSGEMVERIKAMDWKDTNLLMMSSGNFDGIDFAALADEIL